MFPRLAIAALVLAASSALAQNAQDELERQLKDMVGKPPTKLKIEFEGLDQPNYKLAEAWFELDGSTLPSPSAEKLNSQGRHLIFHGDVKPGKHALVAKLAITDVGGALFSYEAGYTFKLAKSIAFEQNPGLEVQFTVEADVNPSEKDKNKKWDIKAPYQLKMLAKLEDGSMPDVPKPNLKVAEKETPDAGAAVAELSPAEKAKVLKEQQAEDARAKKQAAMEAAAAKKQAAADAKAAAAEEKKRKREDAAAAKVAAAEEKKRKREEALASAKQAKEPKEPGEPKQPAQGGEPSQPSQPTEPVADVAVDAGPTVAVVEPPKTPPLAPTAPPAAEADSGGGLPLPLPVLIGIVIALLGIIVFVVARRKSQQPPY